MRKVARPVQLPLAVDRPSLGPSGRGGDANRPATLTVTPRSREDRDGRCVENDLRASPGHSEHDRRAGDDRQLGTAPLARRLGEARGRTRQDAGFGLAGGSAPHPGLRRPAPDHRSGRADFARGARRSGSRSSFFPRARRNPFPSGLARDRPGSSNFAALDHIVPGRLLRDPPGLRGHRISYRGLSRSARSVFRPRPRTSIRPSSSCNMEVEPTTAPCRRPFSSRRGCGPPRSSPSSTIQHQGESQQLVLDSSREIGEEFDSSTMAFLLTHGHDSEIAVTFGGAGAAKLKLRPEVSARRSPARPGQRRSRPVSGSPIGPGRSQEPGTVPGHARRRGLPPRRLRQGAQQRLSRRRLE